MRGNGVFGSLEFHLPVWRDKEKSPILTVAPFVDFAVGWDNVEFVGPTPAGGIDRRQETLASVGLGLIYTPRKNVSVQVFWRYGLNREFVQSNGDNLQDYGVEFSVKVAAF